jgi:GTPase Era involved in 16S rRNA processing
MQNTIHGLRNDLTQISSFLNQGGFLSFSGEERLSLLESSRKLQEKLDAVSEGFLTVGLLGGTGVGKSSIMNALAGEPVSSVSHRRPHTDKVLIYRHLQAELPPVLRRITGRGEGQVFWHEITHEAAAIRQILLCDLPDFDSLAGEHHERVLRFLEHLDVLVWVTSPEKYADARFYEFLQKVPKARQNFYFILNKADLFFHDQSPDTGYDQLARVTARFQQHLKENGFSHPLIYSLSAVQALRSEPLAPWNQFPSFRHQIFQHRDAKEVMAIKAANLDVEIGQLLSKIEEELSHLEVLRGALQSFISEMERERTDWVRPGKESIGLWLDTHYRKQTFSRFADPSPLVGPGYTIAVLIRDWQRKRHAEEERDILSELFREEGPIVSLHQQLERIENRMTHRLLTDGLPASYIEQFKDGSNGEDTWEELKERMQYFVRVRVLQQDTRPFRSFRAMQYLTYSLFFGFFLLAMGGTTAWGSLLSQPSWSHLATLAATMIINIFSPPGLAGLVSYVVLNIFLGFRFYGRFKKSLQRRTQKFIESLKLELGKVWEEELDAVLTRLNHYHRELEAQASVISLLQETRKKD